MARDPNLPLTDVQWVLGHVHLSTTQLYLTPAPDEVIAEVLAHHRRQAAQGATSPGRVPPPAPGYRPETMETLFEGRSQ
jgi:hypothetical protein